MRESDLGKGNRVTTEYHAKLYAHELSKRHSVADAEKLAGALLDAPVDLNPHQVEAALFAFKSPLSKGAILADEVGLGKTIEAGLVVAQKWTEGRRRILVVTPANLRKQWSQEVEEKFFLPTIILEARNYNKMKKDGVRRPFEQKALVICSYQFAARHADELMVIPWDLVIIDEAHRCGTYIAPTTGSEEHSRVRSQTCRRCWCSRLLAIGVFLRPYGTSMAGGAGAVYYIKRRQDPHRVHLTPNAGIYVYAIRSKELQPMPNITMLDIEQLRKTKLRPFIDKCLEHRAPDPGFHAIMGHNIDLREAMFVAWDACFNKGRIPHTLKEVIRVQLSRAANCSY